MASSGRPVGDGNVPPPAEHGGDAARVAAALGLERAELIDLSASLNPFAPDVAALAVPHLRAALGHYPDDGHATTILADALAVDPELVVLTNGGAEAIALVAGLVERGSVVDPEFSLYRRHLPVVDPVAGRWRSNPSNPLGVLAGPVERARVWDEAFYPLATGRWSAGATGAWRLGSLTKLWACPGLRLGYALAPDRASGEALRARRPRWSVNGLALALLPELLEATDLIGWQRLVDRLRSQLTAELRSLGFEVTPAAANWVLVHSVRPLRTSLAYHGIVVRDCAGFGLAGTYRVALPRPDQLDRVLTAFADVGSAGVGSAGVGSAEEGLL